MIPLAEPRRGDDRDDSRFAIVDIAQHGGGVVDHDPAVGVETLVGAADDGRARPETFGGLEASETRHLEASEAWSWAYLLCDGFWFSCGRELPDDAGICIGADEYAGTPDVGDNFIEMAGC